ncbi:MAG TPA: hypothetical protein VF358_03310, partial [Syntrophales bacterium]
VKRHFQDIAQTMPVRGDRNETMTVNVQELKKISFDLISGGMSDDLGRDLIAGDPLQLLHVHGHALVPVPPDRHRMGDVLKMSFN